MYFDQLSGATGTRKLVKTVKQHYCNKEKDGSDYKSVPRSCHVLLLTFPLRILKFCHYGIILKSENLNPQLPFFVIFTFHVKIMMITLLGLLLYLFLRLRFIIQ